MRASAADNEAVIAVAKKKKKSMAEANADTGSRQYGPEPAAPADDSELFTGSIGVNSEAQTEHVSVSVNQHDGLKSSSPTKTT